MIYALGMAVIWLIAIAVAIFVARTASQIAGLKVHPLVIWGVPVLVATVGTLTHWK